MENEVFPKTVKQNYYVCAIVFGVDESILNIELIDGFQFVKKPIVSEEENLIKVFQTDAIGFQRQYYDAIIHDGSLSFGSVICFEKHIEIESSPNDSIEFWHQQNIDDIKSIDDQIRIIRLFKEGSIRVKYISFNLKSENYGPTEIDLSFGNNSILRVGESFTTKPLSIMHFTREETTQINRALNELSLPLSDSLLNSAHIYYDLSYHTELYIAVTLLITALEIIFLKKGDSKKEPLSKRCASYIGTTDKEINRYYQCLKDSYEKRSDFVHEGNALFITENIVLFLRECVRKSILKALDSTETKTERIKRLKEFVENNQKLFGD